MTSRGRTVFGRHQMRGNGMSLSLPCDHDADHLLVGNLPFDVSEEQVVQIMSAVGPVLAFR